MTNKELKLQIIEAGHKAVAQLIKVAKEDIIKPDPNDELAADRLKNAAATKKLAIFDAFEILSRVESEKEMLGEGTEKKKDTDISRSSNFVPPIRSKNSPNSRFTHENEREFQYTTWRTGGMTLSGTRATCCSGRPSQLLHS